MHRSGRASRADRFLQDRQIPSFSSTLLDKIYRSIDETEPQPDEAMSCSQSKCSSRVAAQDPHIDAILRACLAGELTPRNNYMSSEGDVAQRRQVSADSRRKLRVDDDFFSSNSSSSDSSSTGFSSSDTELIYRARPMVSSFVPPPIPRPKPVRTSVCSTARMDKINEERRQKALFQEQRRTAPPLFDYRRDYHSMEEAQAQVHHDETIMKSKSRALKIYANLKKVKQPISPGGRLSNFINSIFASSGNVKKPKSLDDMTVERKLKTAAQSPAASFSRSCLSKNNPPGAKEKRTVQFYPVSVNVDEDLKPCGHKTLHKQQHSASLMSALPPNHRRAGRSPEHNVAVERSWRVDEAARDFLRDYHRNQKRNRSMDAYDDEDDDGTASCSSSDLFELDHLEAIGGSSGSRYCEELPVYETTRVGRNLAIANGLIV